MLRKLIDPSIDPSIDARVRLGEFSLVSRRVSSLKEVLQYLADNGGSAQMKWYDHKEDLITLSKLFPNRYFKLSGEGEERGDEWEAEFFQGKAKRCLYKRVAPDMQAAEWGKWEGR